MKKQVASPTSSSLWGCPESGWMVLVSGGGDGSHELFEACAHLFPGAQPGRGPSYSQWLSQTLAKHQGGNVALRMLMSEYRSSEKKRSPWRLLPGWRKHRLDHKYSLRCTCLVVTTLRLPGHHFVPPAWSWEGTHFWIDSVNLFCGVRQIQHLKNAVDELASSAGQESLRDSPFSLTPSMT